MPNELATDVRLHGSATSAKAFQNCVCIFKLYLVFFYWLNYFFKASIKDFKAICDSKVYLKEKPWVCDCISHHHTH